MYKTLQPLRIDIEEIGDVSPVPSLPVSATTLREHCRAYSSDDTLLDLYLRAAIAWAEGATDRTIVARSHSWVLREFPCGDYQEICLPRGKTQSVESIQYSSNGTVTTLHGPSSAVPGTSYQEDLRGSGGGVLMPNRSAVWPSTDLDVPAPVVINFTAGYSVGEVPEDLQHALLLAVDDCFEFRGTADIQEQLKAEGKNFGLRSLLVSPFALHRIY